MSTDLSVWLDAVYAAWVDTPFDQLDKINQQWVKQVARLDPEEARKTWGMRPEHLAMAGNLGKGADVRKPADPAEAVRQWEQARGVRAGLPSLRNPRG